MNDYRYEDLAIGMTETFEVKISEEKMKAFLAITNDLNPLHNDGEFAKARGYEDKVVYGMLTASFLSTLAGVYLPGRRSLIQGMEINFRKPVLVGDTLNVKGVVDELNDTVKQIVLKVVITNQKQEKVLKGTMKIGVMDEG